MRLLAITLLCCTMFCTPALAQSGANVSVQLPNFSTFGVNTSVLVPDSGPSPLARERQAFYSRFTPGGLNASRSVGIQRRDAMVAATVQIHDPQAADAELLRAAKARRANLSRQTLAGQIGAARRRRCRATEPGSDRSRSGRAIGRRSARGKAITGSRPSRPTGRKARSRRNLLRHGRASGHRSAQATDRTGTGPAPDSHAARGSALNRCGSHRG